MKKFLNDFNFEVETLLIWKLYYTADAGYEPMYEATFVKVCIHKIFWQFLLITHFRYLVPNKRITTLLSLCDIN